MRLGVVQPQVPRSLQQQRGLLLFRPAHLVERLVQELDDVELIICDRSPWKVRRGSRDKRARHVHAHVRDLAGFRVVLLQFLPKRSKLLAYATRKVQTGHPAKGKKNDAVQAAPKRSRKVHISVQVDFD